MWWDRLGHALEHTWWVAAPVLGAIIGLRLAGSAEPPLLPAVLGALGFTAVIGLGVLLLRTRGRLRR